MQDFHNLNVWEKSHRLVLEIYKVSITFPRQETYGLTSQMRRSASSIPTNIAEGCGRRTDADFAHFLQISAGSANELEYQLLLIKDLGWISLDIHKRLHDDLQTVKRMLISLIQKLRA